MFALTRSIACASLKKLNKTVKSQSRRSKKHDKVFRNKQMKAVIATRTEKGLGFYSFSVK